jgi:hypothetical protein
MNYTRKEAARMVKQFRTGRKPSGRFGKMNCPNSPTQLDICCAKNYSSKMKNHQKNLQNHFIRKLLHLLSTIIIKKSFLVTLYL